MAPQESPKVVLAEPTSNARSYKLAGKAMELPVVSDVVAEVTKITEPYSPLVEEGFKIVKDTAMGMQEKVQEKVGSCVDTLDSIASDGLDKLTTAVPALNKATPELLETTKTTAISVIDTAQEIIASFKVVRFGIRVVDACISVIDPIIPSSVVSKVQSVRRHLRAVRRAGAKRDGEPCNESSLLMEMAKMLKLNILLSFLGMQLVTVEDNESSIPEANGGVMEVDEDVVEDPDYVPNVSESDDSLEYRSDTEVTTQDSQEEVEAVAELEDCPTTPNCEKVEHKVVKIQENSEEESLDELGSDIEQVQEVDATDECNTPACVKVEHTNAAEVVPIGLGSDEEDEQLDEMALGSEDEQLDEVVEDEECRTPKCVKDEHEGRRFQEDEA